MFIGAINHKLRGFFWEAALSLDGRDIFIGCSGNFTIEQIITRRAPGATIHSNDIALYSSMIGRAITGAPLKVDVVEESFKWLQPYLDRGGAEQAAVLLILMEMLNYEKNEKVHNARMWEHYLAKWDSYFEQSLARVLKSFASICIEEYTMVDVGAYFPKDGVMIGFLPTYVGGYEKLYKRVDEILEWNEPAYELLTDERREATVQLMTQGDYILYDDKERDLPCVARADQFGRKAVYIYSNLPLGHGLYRRKLNESIPCYQILGVDDEICVDEILHIVKSDNATINHYRNLYLKKGIEPAAGDLCFLVLAGDKVFGFLIYKAYSKMGERGSVYLLSDFVVNSRRHKRLSKLLLLVSLAKEMKEFLEEATVSRVKGVVTTAFTKKPVSMKYRGVYQLIKRVEGSHLNYGAEFKDYRLKEALRIWMKRYEK